MKLLTHDEAIAESKKLTDAYWHGYTGQPLNLVHFQTWSQAEHDCYQMGRSKWISEGMR